MEDLFKYFLIALGLLAAALIFLGPVYLERRRKTLFAKSFAQVFDEREALDELRFHERYFKQRGVPFYVTSKIRNILEEESGTDMSGLRAEDNFYENLAFLFASDTLDGVELIMRIEQEFDISLSDDEVIQARTVEDLILLVWEKTQTSARATGS